MSTKIKALEQENMLHLSAFNDEDYELAEKCHSHGFHELLLDFDESSDINLCQEKGMFMS